MEDTIIDRCAKKALNGEEISKEEALELAKQELQPLSTAAEEIRKVRAGNSFDLCTIINGKCGKCSEDCKYCAQSAHYSTDCTDSYGLLSTKQLLEQARRDDERGALRFSIVTSGKRLSDLEVEQVCESIRAIKSETGIKVCVSFGLLDEAQFTKVREAGASRVHCNLESSRQYFKNVCTTHSYDEKIETLKAAQRAGLELCSGGIIGLGETMEDRIDMIITARELGVKSVPVNVLNPIPGTPYENNKTLSNEEVCRVISVFRFLMPDASIRLAGGRGLLGDKGERCFKSGANAAITGDMLTTSGISIETDLKLMKELGFQIN